MKNLPRVLMTASAILLSLVGAFCTFAPDVVLRRLGAPVTSALLLVVQMLGALALGHAMLNWISRHALLGGIYGRPVVLGNVAHFTTAALGMVKLLAGAAELRVLWPLAAAYAVLAVGFGRLLFRHPIPTPLGAP